MASNAIIQCTSSSSHPITTFEYDVFVSFRGEDTRNNFTGFLFEALKRKSIEAFKDDKDIRKGESIARELLRAIEGSRVFIVVFSKDYASSTWCLRELAHIWNCIQRSPRPVLPIFHEVNPSEVRKQSGYYEKAFAQHEERFREDKEKMEEVKIWREALTRMANLSGWDIRNKPQHTQIEEIVKKITNILGHKFSSLPSDNLVGMEHHVEKLSKLLRLGSVEDIRVVGISGMGGIGKTTLGRALYERISHQYDFRCYIDDVSKIYRGSGTLGVQKQLLCQSLDEKNLEIYNVSEGTCLVWTRLHHARVLIVLDNVDQVAQLKMFTGSRDTLLHECLGGGSRIIIISRDQHILRTHGVDDVYQVKPLDDAYAIRLFCRNAFRSDSIMNHYVELTYDVLSHVQGHPLAIQVLGSSLFGRDVLQWRSALARLGENKNKDIMDVLRIGFDELEDTEKEIFLDIACFFSFSLERDVKEILDFRGFHPEYGLQVLIDKSLITIENGTIRMHGLLIDLGMCIVREKSPKQPRKWSRLWDYNDLHKVMLDNKAADYLEAIVVKNMYSFPQKTMRADALSKMSHLKLLILGKMNFSGRLDNLSNELGYLTWKKYPFECLPPSFEPDKLVELFLPYSNIKQLWEGTKSLPNLRRLDLSHSKKLIELPDFVEALNLELLDLQGCIQLRQIHPSIGLLKKLTFFNLKNCKNLVSLPNSILGLCSLEYLSLSGCSKLYNIQSLDEPRDSEHLKKCYICEDPVHSKSTSSYSREHKSSVSRLLPSLPIFPCICELDLSFCNLAQIPDAVGNLCCLERLDLSGNNFATLLNLKKLSKLFCLKLQHCKQLKYLPELPSRIDLPSPTYIRPWIKPILTGRHAGLYIFNCPELVEREPCTSMGLLWMIQLVQAYHQYKLLDYPLMEYGSIESVTVGSEIPRWFSYQHVGSLISIDASPVMRDNKWIGLACCAIFVVRHETVLVTGPSKTKERFPFLGDIPVDFYGNIKLVSDQSDHVWLFFVNRKRFYHECLLQGPPYLGSLKWEFKICGKAGFQVEVKKYGYRWVYKHDLELTRMDATNSSLENTIQLLQNQFANLRL